VPRQVEEQVYVFLAGVIPGPRQVIGGPLIRHDRFRHHLAVSIAHRVPARHRIGADRPGRRLLRDHRRHVLQRVLERRLGHPRRSIEHFRGPAPRRDLLLRELELNGEAIDEVSDLAADLHLLPLAEIDLDALLAEVRRENAPVVPEPVIDVRRLLEALFHREEEVDALVRALQPEVTAAIAVRAARILRVEGALLFFADAPAAVSDPVSEVVLARREAPVVAATEARRRALGRLLRARAPERVLLALAARRGGRRLVLARRHFNDPGALTQLKDEPSNQLDPEDHEGR